MVSGQDRVRVLCVDDEAALLSVLTDMLSAVDEAIRAETLQDPTRVREELRSEPGYDCVVCDYDMPERTGLDVFEAVRESFPEVPFILYTGKGSEEIASEAISAGVTDYLQKGTGTEHYELLANRIREYVDRYRTDREYELTEQRYRRLVEQSVVGIGLSQDQVFRYMNPKFAEIFGYTREELIGESALAVVDEADHERVESALLRRESGEVDSVHYVVTGKDKGGNRFDLEVNGSRVQYEGKPAVLGVVQPLDVRRKALAALGDEEVSELRSQLEYAHGKLVSQDGEDVAAARDAIRAGLAAVRDGPLSDGDQTGTADLAAQFRAAWEEHAPQGATLSVEASRDVIAGRTALSELFGELLEAWSELDHPLAVELTVTADGFDVAVTPPEDGASVDPPLDPPALGRTVELLDWDVLVSESGPGVVYRFRDVEFVK